MVNKKLMQAIESIGKEKENLAKKIEQETNEYKKHDLNFEFTTVMDQKYSKIYHEMIDNISGDKQNEIKAILTTVLGSKENYERLEKNTKIHFPNSTFKEMCKGLSTTTVIKNFDTLIDGLSDLLDDKTMNDIAETVKNYVPNAINNTPIHPCTNRIEAIKNSKKFNSLPEKERKIVAKQLDEINEVVKESPRGFSEAQTNFDSDYEHITLKVNDKLFKNYLNEHKDFAKSFDYYDQNFVIKNDIAGDAEKIEIAKSPAFKLTQKTQESVLKIWKKMDELQIISAGEGAESGSKIYGFQKLYDARENINKALSSENFENLKELKEEYEKQLKNIREMYKIIKTELNPSPENLPGNVQNFRENFVPAEFKNDICTNATFNGMYNAYSIVKSLGVSAEEFLKNPQPYVDKKFNEEITKFHIDKIYKNLSFEDKLARLYSDKSKAGLNAHGLPRMVSTLTYFEKDANQKMNDLIFCAVQSGKVNSIFEDEQVCYNYFSKERTKTFINLVLVNPEDRDFNKLKSHDSISGDKFTQFKAFDLASYLKENSIPAEAINERITKILGTAYKFSCDGEKEYIEEQKKYNALMKDYKAKKIKNAPEPPILKSLSMEDFAKMVKDVQQGVIDYIMLSNPANDKGYEKLIEFLKNPVDALKSLNLEEEYVEILNKLKGNDAVLNDFKNRAKLESIRNLKDVRAKENSYNKTAERILKEANKISLKVANETDMKKIEDLQKQSVLKMNELKQLQKAETERLSKEYKAGNIPSEYYKKRVENIVTLKHNEKIAIFDDGLDKNEYLKSTGLEQLTKAEANKLFECEIEKQKTAKEFFINNQFLQKNKLISTNGLVSSETSVQQANFEQINVEEIENDLQKNQREPIFVGEAKIESSNEKSEPQKEIDPKQTVKMP